MERKAIITLVLLTLLMSFFLPAPVSTAEGGLLPSLTETVGIAMPSLGEALGRYPDEETENADGSITELYNNIKESQFTIFSVYLEQQGAELADYKVEKGILSAKILVKGDSFNLVYDIDGGKAKVIYPSGTYDERMKNAKSHFAAAQKLLDGGKTTEALTEIIAIPQYNQYTPAVSLLDNNDLTVAAREAYLVPGSVIKFGQYEQDNNTGNGQEPIEWIILDVQDNKALLLSKHCLDCQVFNTIDGNYPWEISSLRTWMNEEFYNSAFSASQQTAIMITDVDNSASQGEERLRKYIVDRGNTQDKVYLLSYVEVNHYLDTPEKRQCKATAYAKSLVEKDYLLESEYAHWWLRSPGGSGMAHSVASVKPEGNCTPNSVNYFQRFIRPVVWVNLNSEEIDF